MDDYLDGAIGSKICLLPDLLRGLQKEEAVLQGQLVGDSLTSGNEWLKVVSDVQSTISDLQNVGEQLHTVTEEMMKEDNWKSATSCVMGISELVKEMGKIEQLQAYLTWLRQLQHLSTEIDNDLLGGQNSEAIAHYSELCGACNILNKSKCAHLKEWALTIHTHSTNLLKNKLIAQFSSLLSSLKWPLIGSASSSHDLTNWDTHQREFAQSFVNLMKLDMWLTGNDQSSSSSKELSAPLPLPLEIMVLPLRKRFNYHFMENRKTNDLKKPEWYLTQVSNWLRDHIGLLEERVQPILNQDKYNHIDAKLEFYRGLLQVVVGKLEVDIKEVVSHDSLMSHLVDELLLFDHDVHLSISLSPPETLSTASATLSVLNVLLSEVPFDKWRNLEKKFAIDGLHEMMMSETAWSLAYKDLCGADETMVPQCTQDLMMLIKAITERYHYLPSKHHQLLFLELQVDLLLEFHQDLSQAASKTHPLDPRFAAYFNASNYIQTILRKWGEELFFLELFYYSKQVHSEVESQPVQALQQVRKTDPEYCREEGSIFEAVVTAFSSLIDELQQRMVGEIIEQAKLHCHKYRAERWHNMRDHKNQLCMEVSAGAADLLTYLRDNLLLMEDYVSPLLLPGLMEKFSEDLDLVILTEVILRSSFNDAGVEQLDHDIKHYFAPLLARHCDHILGRQLLERVQEAVSLLSLLHGSAQLLIDVLRNAGSELTEEQALAAANTTLSDMSIHTLSPQLAIQILKRRIYSTS